RASLPGWVPKNTLNLGLDLQGGSYLLLEVDLAALQADRVTNLIEDVRVTLRDQGIAIDGIARQDARAVVTMLGAARYSAAVEAHTTCARPPAAGLVARSAPPLTDRRIGVLITDEVQRALRPRVVDPSIIVIRNRIDALSTREPSIT